MPAGAHSTARVLVSMSTPAFETLYATWCWGTFTTRPDIDETFTITPGRPAATHPRARAWQHRKVPVRLTSRTRCHDSRDTARLSSQDATPAALTRIVGRPNASAARSKAAATLRSSV